MVFMKNIIIFLVAVTSMVLSKTFAQAQVSFNFQVTHLGGTQYEFFMQIPNPEGVQFIEIGFIDDMEQDFASELFSASLNKKQDGNYYFAIGTDEFQINPKQGFQFVIKREFEFENLPIERASYIKCLNRDFYELGINRQIIQ